MQNAFFASLQSNNVKYFISGHDHIHQRSLISSPDGLSKVQQLICASDSSKFYTPKATSDASTTTDGIGRNLINVLNTGWSPRPRADIKSNVLTLWGMAGNLGSDQTDTHTLSMNYDPNGDGVNTQPQNGSFGLVTRDNGRWVLTVDKNVGGAKRFIAGPWDANAGYGLGTYGVDAATNTAWAVINHNGDFTVAWAGSPAEASLWFMVFPCLAGGYALLRRRRRS